MESAEFERVAGTIWDAIPPEYKEGIDGLVIEEGAHPHPEHPDVFTLGECVTEEYPSQYGGPDTIRSAVVLYYGSFRELAEDDETFDWEAEIDETIVHELQHHLESLATEDSLEDLDHAVEMNFKWLEGEPFDAFFFRAGERLNENTYRVESDVFIEVSAPHINRLPYEFEWEGLRYQVELPASLSDVTFVYVDNVPTSGDGDFSIVRVKKQGMLGTLRSAFRGGFGVDETSVTAVELA